MSTLLLDTHVLQWWSAEPHRVSRRARLAIEDADELAVAAITWCELGWLARRQRIHLTVPVRSWLDGLSARVSTLPLTPAIADEAVSLPASFAGDPADRLIYATALERGLRFVTKDRRLRDHRRSRRVTIW